MIDRIKVEVHSTKNSILFYGRDLKTVGFCILMALESTNPPQELVDMYFLHCQLERSRNNDKELQVPFSTQLLALKNT